MVSSPRETEYNPSGLGPSSSENSHDFLRQQKPKRSGERRGKIINDL